MKAVAYYRTRPSEPDASELALQLQREAVQDHIAKGGYTLVAEFVEQEGDDGTTYPAYAAAVQAALACRKAEGEQVVALVIASHAGIGTGTPFQEPRVEGESKLFHVILNTILLPPQAVIPLPSNALGPVCLCIESRPRQGDTLIYLCNADAGELAEVTVTFDAVSLHDWHRLKPADRWSAAECSHEEHWDRIGPGTCVLADTLSHFFSDMVHRCRLTYTDALGCQRTVEADGHGLNAFLFSHESGKVWVRFHVLSKTVASAEEA